MHPQAQVVNRRFRALRLERSVGAGCLVSSQTVILIGLGDARLGDAKGGKVVGH